GRGHRLSRAQVEAGVVQRAPDRVADEQAVGERAVVVRAERAGDEHLVAHARDDDLLVADAGAHDAAGLHGGDRNAVTEVRQGGISSGHVGSSQTVPWDPSYPYAASERRWTSNERARASESAERSG